MNLSRFNNKHFLVLMGNGLTVAIGFATSFLLFHFLSMEAVGMWFFIQSLVALCEAARYGFLATATVTFYAGTTLERGATVLGSVWFLALGLSFIILSLNTAALFFWGNSHNVEIVLCIKWVGITYLSSVPIDISSWRLQAEEKYVTMFLYRMVNSVTTILAFIMLIAFHKMTLENALLYNFLINCVTSFLGIVSDMSGLKYIFRRSTECVREVLNYGKYMLGTTSFSALLVNADTWIINFMLGPSAVAVYNLAVRFMAVVELPLRSFITTGMSEMAISFNRNDRDHVTYIFKKYSGMLTIAFVPMVMAALLFADIPVNLLGGAQYSNSIAANSFRLFMVASLFYPIDRFNGLALDVIRQTKVNFYKVIIMLAVKVACNFAGLAIFGNIYGVNLSCFIVTIAAIFFGNYQLRKHLDYKIPDILLSGYQETKLLIQKNTKLSRFESRN
jgi:O-antigen/teichoic acid export membrane protein